MNQVEIAKKLGISQTAVSLVLNNPATTKVSNVKKQQISDYLHQNNYTNQSSVRRTWNIGFVQNKLTEKGNEFYHRFIEGIENAAEREKYSLFIEVFRNDELNIIKKRKVDGIICGTGYFDYLAGLAAPSKIPVVLLNTFDPQLSYDSVMPDNHGSMFTVVEHLVRLGHKRIAYLTLTPPKNTVTQSKLQANFQERINGYKNACKVFGLNIDFDEYLLAPQIKKQEDTASQVGMTLKYWQQLKKNPTAVIGSNDNYAELLLECALQEGLQVPKDLSIVGIDNREQSSAGRTFLTTVDQNFRKMGKLSAELLIKRITDPKGDPVRVCCKSSLIIRHSTGLCQTKG